MKAQGNRIMMSARMNRQRLSDFWVLVSEQPFASDLLSPTLDDPRCTERGRSWFFVAGQAGRPSDVQVGQWGRYVRVQLSDAEYLNIAEVGVCGYAVTPTPTDTPTETATITNTPVVSATPTLTPTSTVPAAATPTAASTPAPPALEHAQYVYDGDNNLVKSVINGVETYYIGQYYEKAVDGETTTVRKYYFAGSTRIAMREDGTLYWLLSDHLGSTSITTEADGTLYSEVRYSAFGEIRWSVNNTPTDYLYTGQRVEEAGLYFYVARFYDPQIMHFVQADSIVPGAGNALSYNRYAYVNYSPLNFVDPSGHDPIYGWGVGPGPSGGGGTGQPSSPTASPTGNSTATLANLYPTLTSIAQNPFIQAPTAVPSATPPPIFSAASTSTPYTIFNYQISGLWYVNRPIDDWGQLIRQEYLHFPGRSSLSSQSGLDLVSDGTGSERGVITGHTIPIRYQANIHIEYFQNATVVNLYQEYSYTNTQITIDGTDSRLKVLLQIDQVQIISDLPETGAGVYGHQQVPVIFNFPYAPQQISIDLAASMLGNRTPVQLFPYGTWQNN